MSSPAEPTNFQKDNERRPWPHYNAFRDFVMEEFTRRKQTYPTPTNAPFVRMTACTQEPELGYNFFTLGLHGYASDEINIFDVTYGNGREIIGYAYDLKNSVDGRATKRLISTDELTVSGVPEGIRGALNEAQINTIQRERIRAQALTNGTAGDSLPGGAHPIPGIMDVTITKGNGVPFVANVQWQCFNRAQLEYLRHHFMVVGQHVVIEWGQQFSDRQFTKILDFSDTETVTNELVNAVMQGRKYVINNFCRPNQGNYDFLVGHIGPFKVDLDPSTGIYLCSLTVYSVGEELWGLQSANTYINKTAVIGSTEASNPTTIHDFFFPGTVFDALIEKYAQSDPSMVADHKEGWRKNDVNKSDTNEENRLHSTNPNDYQFISWKCFVEVIIPHMFAVITHPKTKQDLFTFTSLYRPGIGETEADQDWVGNNPYLKSTNPDAMIIYKEAYGGDVPGFQGAGDFDRSGDTNNPGNSSKGKLTNGVWLNTGMIREAFGSTSNFQSGLRTVLNHMNGATAGYWNLQLFFDEEVARYKIVDNNYGDLKLPSMYKFNVGGQGELLKIEFDSAFAPALVTQMALFRSIRSREKPTKEELLKDYPSIGTTGTMIFALNWTNLTNILERALDDNRRAGLVGAPEVARENQAVGGSLPTSETRTLQRVLGVSDGNYVKSSLTTLTSNAGTAVGSPSIGPLRSLEPANITPVRNSAAPLTYEPTKYNRLTELTIAEVMARQSAMPRRLFAVGKYQWIPDTLRLAVKALNIPTSRKFDATTQEELFKYFYDKCQGFGAYMRDGGSLDNAHRALAMEFAAIPVPYTEVLGKGKSRRNVIAGRSFYDGDSAGNNARISNAEVRAALQTKNLDRIKSMIASGESGGSYEAANNILPRQKARSLGRPGDAAYYAAINNLPLNGTVLATNTTPRPAPTQPAPSQPAPVPVTIPGTPDATTTLKPVYTSTNIDDARIKAADEDVRKRFGGKLINLIELLPSRMLAAITQHGYTNHPGKQNSFVAPFQTDVEVVLTLVGISGISITDGFYVDKLPFIFEEYGCFQTTRVNEHISDRGWTTSVKGIFRLTNLEPIGPISPVVTEKMP